MRDLPGQSWKDICWEKTKLREIFISTNFRLARSIQQLFAGKRSILTKFLPKRYISTNFHWERSISTKFSLPKTTFARKELYIQINSAPQFLSAAKRTLKLTEYTL
ncbi:hypothetical protein PRUPE_6G068400 [Prunus persica]|uniref:Uncharacterized protein n=1 Tax=Prunus persica TaxID=3760 RepID=M5W1X7_PRUPE|nr:hypothetical protein PRUPE_6G068400 [Prunus persica]